MKSDGGLIAWHGAVGDGIGSLSLSSQLVTLIPDAAYELWWQSALGPLPSTAATSVAVGGAEIESSSIFTMSVVPEPSSF